MQWLWDHDGRRYLDFYGGICTVGVGHCHPSVSALLLQSRTELLYVDPEIGQLFWKRLASMIAVKRGDV